MNLYGLIGFPLTHSFSKKYFTEKFQKEGIPDSLYELFPIENLDQLDSVLKKEGLRGLNVTIPYKEKIYEYLVNTNGKVDDSVYGINAVNVIKIKDKELIGYNSDYYGFREAFDKFRGPEDKFIKEITKEKYKALVLGDGGAAKAVKAVLKKENIDYKIVSRKSSNESVLYSDITQGLLDEYNIIINTTPLGMLPDTDSCPEIPYQYLSSHNYLFDLVYNPSITKFMNKGKEMGAHVRWQGGLDMLHLQAEKAWEIWNS
jgi:shikimate dehydrogenase